MAVHDWVAQATAVETYEPFQGKLVSGSLIGSPSWVDGVDGLGIKFGENDGAVIPVTAETARGYPTSVTVWFSFDAGAPSTPIFQWGSVPSVGAQLFGSGSTEVPGTVQGWVRMSNGSYALRARSGPLQPGQWHCLTIAVQQTTLWGGCRATMFINGERVASGSYGGSLFNVVNFDRPQSVTFGVGGGGLAVDEFVTQEAELNITGARNVYASAESLSAGARAGWGIVF